MTRQQNFATVDGNENKNTETKRTESETLGLYEVDDRE